MIEFKTDRRVMEIGWPHQILENPALRTDPSVEFVPENVALRAIPGNAPGNPSSGVASLCRLDQLSPRAGIAQGRVQPNAVVPAQKSVGSIP